MVDEKKDEEKLEDASQEEDQDFTSGFDEESDSSQTPSQEEGTLQEDAGTEGDVKTDETGDDKSAIEPDDKTDWKAEAEKLKKQAEDNQSWATTMAQENATLKTDLETARKKPEIKPDESQDTLDGGEVPEDLQGFYKDYPEFKDAVQFEAKRLFKETLGDLDVGKLKTTITGLEQDISQERFNNVVLGGFFGEDGKYVNGHPDAFVIFKSPEWKTWMETEQKKDPNIGQIADPKEAIKFIGRYKADMAKGAAEIHDQDLKGKAKEMEENAAGSISSGAGGPGGDEPKVDENDYEGGFEEEAKAA